MYAVKFLSFVVADPVATTADYTPFGVQPANSSGDRPPYIDYSSVFNIEMTNQLKN